MASASPRRRELLAQAGYLFEVAAADVDESVIHGEPPQTYVERLAREKAQTVFERVSQSAGQRAGEWARAGSQVSGARPAAAGISQKLVSPGALIVLGADTTVVIGSEILAKPEDAEDAKRMLRRLSGRVHQVLTGVAAATRAGVASGVETTLVTFSEIPEAELDFYCATREPLDKAGAYGIQGYAARWIPRIEGDYFNVMGLPIARVVRMIEGALGR